MCHRWMRGREAGSEGGGGLFLDLFIYYVHFKFLAFTMW